MNPSDSRYGLRRFRFLIRFSRWSPHHRNGSPVLHGISSTTCHPCYPGSRWTPLPLFQRPSSGLPLQDTGSASPFSVTRLRLGSLALRPAALPWETYDLRLLERRFPVLERRTDNSFHGTLTRWIYRRSRRTVCPLLSHIRFRCLLWQAVVRPWRVHVYRCQSGTYELHRPLRVQRK